MGCAVIALLVVGGTVEICCIVSIGWLVESIFLNHFEDVSIFTTLWHVFYFGSGVKWSIYDLFYM